MKILLVEDHAALAEITCRLLRDLYDHEVEHAATGATALEEFKRLAPEIVLIDIHLPDMTGYQLARRLRDEAGAETTILVAITGFGTVLDEASTRASGFDAHFRKPMDFDLLPTLRRQPD